MLETDLSAQLSHGQVTTAPPIATGRSAAGFPSPADEYMAPNLDLNDHLVQQPAATFFMRVSGQDLPDAAIHNGDMLIVDRSLTPRSGRLVIAILDGQMVIRRFKHQGDKTLLTSDNPEIKPIDISDDPDIYLWGTVTTIIHYA